MNLVDSLDTVFVFFENIVRNGVSFVAPKLLPPYENLPSPPKPEPPADFSLDSLEPEAAAAFHELELQLKASLSFVGFRPIRIETRRTFERQRWLWGIGREYKAPGRSGIVTDIKSPTGPHARGIAVDYLYVPDPPGTNPSTDERDAALKSIAAANPEFKWGGNFLLSSGDADPAHWEFHG